MRLSIVLFDYLAWHYSTAIRDLWRIWRDIFSFLVHWFSLPALARSLFAPWRRLGEEYPANWLLNFSEAASVLLVNFLMRVTGFVMRTFILVTGIVVSACFAVLFPFALLVWLTLPLIVLFFIGVGIFLILFS